MQMEIMMIKSVAILVGLLTYFQMGGYFLNKTSAASIEKISEKNKNNVIFIMLDGVRWQEVFRGVDPELSSSDKDEVFPLLKKELQKTGILMGDRDHSDLLTVSNPARMSLPAYQTIMTGEPQFCYTNECKSVSVETMQERLVRELKLDPKEVASIASWGQISLAVEHVTGKTFVNTALEPLNDQTIDAEFAKINEAQKNDIPPWKRARFDRYTYAHAVHYLKKYHPRFIFISMDDSDEWGHLNNYPMYLKALRQYDSWIQDLKDQLKEMGAYGKNTTLIVTTDHGRGSGSSWSDHGLLLPESKYVWLYGKKAGSEESSLLSSKSYTHFDLRPTIEAIFGLNPRNDKKHGRVIKELLSDYEY
jgi:hypothetical protein